MSTPANDPVVGPDGPREVAGLGRVPQRDKRTPQRRPRDAKPRRTAARRAAPPAAAPPAGPWGARDESPPPPGAAPEGEGHEIDALA